MKETKEVKEKRKRGGQVIFYEFKDKKVTIQWVAENAGYTYLYTAKMLRKGVRAEELITKKKFSHSKIVNKKNRKIPLFHFKNINELCKYLNLSRQRVYKKYDTGNELTNNNGNISWKF
jgi:aspartyl-tRNA synthetase